MGGLWDVLGCWESLGWVWGDQGGIWGGLVGFERLSLGELFGMLGVFRGPEGFLGSIWGPLAGILGSFKGVESVGGVMEVLGTVWGCPQSPNTTVFPQRPGQHCPHPERPPAVLGLPAEHR